MGIFIMLIFEMLSMFLIWIFIFTGIGEFLERKMNNLLRDVV